MLLDVAHGVAGHLAERLHADERMPEPGAQVLADAMLAITVRTIEALGAASGPRALPAISERAQVAVEALRGLLA
jgi:hypothetical protein